MQGRGGGSEGRGGEGKREGMGEEARGRGEERKGGEGMGICSPRTKSLATPLCVRVKNLKSMSSQTNHKICFIILICKPSVN
jgi:hypothetical protein